MLPMRRDKFKTKMAISSNYVVHFLHLLATAYILTSDIQFFSCF